MWIEGQSGWGQPRPKSGRGARGFSRARRQTSRVKSLPPGSYPRIALLVNLATSYGRRILEGVHSHPCRAGWELLAESWGDIGMSDLLSGEPADGLIVDGIDSQIQQLLERNPKPVVDISGETGVAGPSRVHADFSQIGRIAAEHFQERGFTRLGFLGLYRSRSSREIGNAFAAACSPFAAHLHRHNTSLNWSGQRFKQRASLMAWLSSLPRPCAVFAADDITARRLLQCCRSLGLQVPQQIAVLGVGDYEMVHTVSDPSLSTVIVPAREIGFRAADSLHQLLQTGTAVHLKSPSPSIAARRSTDSLAWEDPIIVEALEWLQEHAAEKVRIPDVATDLSLSRRSLEQRFQAPLGHGPAEELRRIRLRRAQQLLRETDWGLGPVARAVGLVTPERLCTLFRKQMNLTPGEYRNLLPQPR